MIRNLDNRVEVAVPIYDKKIQKNLKKFIQLQLQDNQKARIINEKQDNVYCRKDSQASIRAQEEIYEFLNGKRI